MALKLPDSAVPMGDFPVAKAVDIDFNDGENLQEKLDNGKLGGAGGGASTASEVSYSNEALSSVSDVKMALDTIVGEINEISGTQLDTVGFSADYKNIILNRKNGLNPYTIPISAIINNASLTELKDIDNTDIGNGKTLIYDAATQKHKYVGSTGTDELVKMDSTGDAHYLVDLLDKQTVINDNGILKVKKLDGQEVTITEINYLKGLTMNVMDLVSAFANGGVKVWETPVNTYSDLSTLDRSAFIDGISYIVYVLIDETHSNAKTTYLCTKTSTTFFGNADSQRNFTTNPIDLANEVTGKLGTSNIDVDNLWTLLTINDTYKTLTTNNEIFGTHGAKAMYDELTTSMGEKANATDLTTHTNNTDIHVTTTDKAKWDKVDEKVDKNSITTTIDSTSTDTQVPTARAVNELNLRGTLINQSVIDKYGTEIIKYPFGRWCIDGNDIAGKFSDIPWGTACIIDITSPIISTRNPWDNTWAYRNYNVQTVENKGTFVRQLESRGTAGVLLDTGWQRVCTTSVADIPKTTLTPVFPGEVKVASGGVAINYIVRNGWCNVNFAFNLASATTFPWTGIATGLPIPANNANILLTDESGKANRTIAIRINSTGTVASRIPVAFTAIDWWSGNISYPVAES